MDTNLFTQRMNELTGGKKWTYNVVLASNFQPNTFIIAITINKLEQRYGIIGQNNGMWLCTPLLPDGTFSPTNNAIWGLTAEGALTNAIIKQLKGEVFK